MTHPSNSARTVLSNRDSKMSTARCSFCQSIGSGAPAFGAQSTSRRVTFSALRIGLTTFRDLRLGPKLFSFRRDLPDDVLQDGHADSRFRRHLHRAVLLDSEWLA